MISSKAIANMSKWALITGASSGIGYQMAISLHKRGYKIIGIAREKDVWEMKPLETEIGIVALSCDISDVEQVKAVCSKVKQITKNRLSILYNNAGICTAGGPAIEADDVQIQRLMNVNVVGHMYMTKYCSEMVIEAQGTIVFTSSVAARVPLSWVSAYAASKAAIDQYALVLRAEMQPFGVKVHSVITGGVNTVIADQVQNYGLHTRFYDVDEVRDSILSASAMSRNPHTSISAEKYAEQVAGQICKRHDVGLNIYRGWGAYFLHLLRWYLPVWLFSFLIQWHFKQRRALRQVHRLYQKEKKNK